MKKVPAVPRLTCTDFNKKYVPTCLSNGVIGITPGPNPMVQGKVVVGGFVFSHPKFESENFALAPYPLGLDIKINDKSIRNNPDRVTIKSQTLDMETGELTTHLLFRPAAGLSVEIEIIQFVSRSVPCLACQEVRLVSNQDINCDIRTFIDYKGLNVKVYTGDTDALTRGWYDEDLIDQALGFKTDRSRLGIATVIIRRPDIKLIRSGLYKMKVKKGITSLFQMIAALVPDLYNPDPHLEAIRLARWGEMLGFEKIREYNQQAWNDLWASRIKIDGNAQDQRALDVAFYYYHSNIHSSTRAGTPPFGLTQHDKYFGHNFWDTDLWLLLPAILTNPAAARTTVEYRHTGLEAARRKAELFGYRGAQYPWEAAVEGWEVTPSCCPTGWAQQHTTPGVAIGVWEYQLATGDEITLREYTWPVLKTIAEWVESRGVFTKRGFEMRHMMGPDEGITNVSNQTYFNLLSRMAVTAAIRCAQKLGYPAPPVWKKIVKQIYLPMDKRKKIIFPYDLDSTVRVHNEKKRIFEEVPAAKSLRTYSLGNLHFLFIHDCPVEQTTFKNTYLHEEKIRSAREPEGGVPGSIRAPGFTSPPYAVCAAFFGERKKAAEFFRNTWEPHWLEPFGMTLEYRLQDYGSYITSFGSLLQSTLLGFTGLRIREGNWLAYPATLPAGWKKIEIDRIWIKGKAVKLSAVHGKKARLKEI